MDAVIASSERKGAIQAAALRVRSLLAQERRVPRVLLIEAAEAVPTAEGRSEVEHMRMAGADPAVAARRSGRGGRWTRNGHSVIALAGALFAVIGLGVISTTPAEASTPGILADGHVLGSGASITSPSGLYRLVMQADGNLVFYTCSHALWNSKTQDKGAWAAMKGGILEIVDPTEGLPIATFGKSGNPGAYLAVQDGGNLVIYPSGGGTPLWFTSYGTRYTPICGGTQLLAGQSVSNGGYTLIMQQNGDLELRKTSTNTLVWSSGTGSVSNAGARMVVQATDGHVVVYSSSNVALWASALPAKSPGSFLTVQGAGNLIEYTPSGALLWEAIGLHPVGVPSWWNGTCDSGYNASFRSAGTWNGLIACGPGGTSRYENQTGSPLGENLEWQCVELSERWLYQEFGLSQQPGDGWQTVGAYWAYIQANPANHYPLTLVTPATASAGRLGPGDVVSYANVNYDHGHTDVVIDTSGLDSSGNGTIKTLNENSGGVYIISVSHWAFGIVDDYGNYMRATGWLHFTG